MAAPDPTTPAPPAAPAREKPVPPRGKAGGWLGRGLAVVILLAALAVGGHWLIESRRDVSTDDAYVNGHVTFVAPRVTGQVERVLVDDNNPVHKGDLLVEIDKEPYQVQVDIMEAAVVAAQADLTLTQAQTRAAEAQTRGLRFNL